MLHWFHLGLHAYAESHANLPPNSENLAGGKKMVATDGPAIIAFYEEDVSRQGALWTPAAKCERAKGHVPRLLHIPLVLFTFIQRESRPLMPHEVLAIMMKHLKKTGATDKQGKALDLVSKWCIVVAQTDAQGDSLVSFTVKVVTEGDDSYFEQWVEQ
jgi:hypothetical protein